MESTRLTRTSTDNIYEFKNNKMKKTYNLEKLDKLTKEMFGEKYTFKKMSEREKGMIKMEYNSREF